MEISYDLTQEDLEAFAIHFAAHAPSIVWRRVLTGGGALAVGLWTAEQNRTPSQIAISLLLMAILVPVLYFLTSGLRRAVLRRGVRKLLATEGKKLLGKHTLELTEPYLREESPAGVTHDGWEKVERIEQGRRHLFLYNRSLYCFVIPKRAFKDAAAAAAFLAEAKRLKALARR